MDRRDGAFFLAMIAAFAFVGAPLVHAYEHALEDESITPATGDTNTLFEALRRVHDRRPTRKAPYSHGPGRSHGDGSLAHLAVALHAAPRPPTVAPSSLAIVRQPQPHPTRRVRSYLLPLFAQGPPHPCPAS